MSYEEIYESSPIVLLLVDEWTAIVHYSKGAEALFQGRAMRKLADLLDGDSVQQLLSLAEKLRIGESAAPLSVKARRGDGSTLLIECVVDKVDGRKGEQRQGKGLVRIAALYDPEGQHVAAGLEKSVKLLRDVIDAASEAMWCIEFSEPVDVTASPQEVVRQVFTNECRWLVSNRAMARLYDLPEELEFEEQAVSAYFQRNAENEAFVGQIIESGYCIDNAPSVDVRHDGSTIYVENTVRAHIIDGRLIRLWGTVRDVTDHRQAQNRLQRQVDNVNNVLGAIPYVLLVIDRSRTVLGINPAFERHFGWNAEQFLGRDAQSLIDLENALPGGRQWYGCERQQWIAEVRIRSGALLKCEALISPVGEEAPDQFVLTLCPLLQDEALMANGNESTA